MKKKTLKLRLNRETLLNLQGGNLQRVVGGVTDSPRCNTEQCPVTISICVNSCWQSCTCTASGCPSEWTECCTG